MQLHASRVMLENQQQTHGKWSAWFGSNSQDLAEKTIRREVSRAKCLIYVTFSCLIHSAEPNSGRTSLLWRRRACLTQRGEAVNVFHIFIEGLTGRYKTRKKHATFPPGAIC